MSVLTLSGQPEKALEYMEGKAFSYREGSSRVREIIIDAQLSLGLKYYNNGDFQKALDHFLMAQVPDEEAGGSGSGNREIQVCYYIGRTYDALENKEQAKSFYTMAIEKGMQGGVDLMGYYLGLNYMKLGEKKKAEEIFMSLVTEGEKQLNQDPDSELDFFAKFGERETENTRVSNAYTIKGLGHKGLGQVDQAEKDLEKAVELKVSNLWAYTELNSL
jgi:tetratricopeptide (TPR) repeat protein